MDIPTIELLEREQALKLKDLGRASVSLSRNANFEQAMLTYNTAMTHGELGVKAAVAMRLQLLDFVTGRLDPIIAQNEKAQACAKDILDKLAKEKKRLADEMEAEAAAHFTKAVGEQEATKKKSKREVYNV